MPELLTLAEKLREAQEETEGEPEGEPLEEEERVGSASTRVGGTNSASAPSIKDRRVGAEARRRGEREAELAAGDSKSREAPAHSRGAGARLADQCKGADEARLQQAEDAEPARG